MDRLKIVKKNYYLVNQVTGDFIMVFPPSYPGDSPEDKKSKNKKTPSGKWRRWFNIVNAFGVKQFDGESLILLKHRPMAIPTRMINGELWALTLKTPGRVNLKK